MVKPPMSLASLQYVSLFVQVENVLKDPAGLSHHKLSCKLVVFEVSDPFYEQFMSLQSKSCANTINSLI